MRVIYKYSMPPRDLVASLASGIYPEEELIIAMPKGAHALHMAIQFNDLVVWALVDPDEAVMAVGKYRIVGTGHDLPDDWSSKWMYVTTLFTGPFVWHVWEKVT